MNKDSKIKLHTGNEMPVIGLGTWKLTDKTADTIAYALEIGYRMIDTSSDYGTQPGVGEGIKKSGIDRKSLYIVTKVEEDDDAYQRTLSNLEELGTDYVDLMLIHRPPADSAGERLWEGLMRAKQEGLTVDIGVSNYPINLIDKLIDASDEIPTVNQIEWSPFGYSPDMFKYATNKKMIIQAYSPLTRANRLDEDICENLADKFGKSPAQILTRWNLQLGTVPLPKANKREHLEQNLDVFDFELSDEDINKLNSLNEHYSSLQGQLPYVQEKERSHL